MIMMTLYWKVHAHWHDYCYHGYIVNTEGRRSKKKVDKVKDNLPPLLSRINGVIHVSCTGEQSIHCCS